MENAIFFLILPTVNTKVCKFSNFNIGTVNETQKGFVKLHKMGEQIKNLLLLLLLHSL